MDIVLTAVVFILIFSVLVIIHEMGHFLVAKRAGIKVEEFGFGLPPRIWGKKKGETLYSINLIPFGGFVKMYGEDSHDLKTAKSKRSFNGKSVRTRFMVIVAGVLMNYLLSLVLLTIGFIAGMQPLLVEGSDFFAAIDNGTITLQEGIVVKDVQPQSPAAQAGLKVNDSIIGVDGKPLPLVDEFNQLLKDKKGSELHLDIRRGNQTQKVVLVSKNKEEFGLKFYDLLDLPHTVIYGVKENSPAAVVGLQNGDEILKINGKRIYFSSQIQEALTTYKHLEIEILRDFQPQTVAFELPQQNSLIITRVGVKSQAEEAGFLSGDILISVNGTAVSSFDELTAITKKDPKAARSYIFLRNGEVKSLQVLPDKNGSIGIYLSTISSYENNFFSYYNGDFPVSAVLIKNVQYPFWQAPAKAFEESGKLASITVGSVLDSIRSIFTQLTVPEGISGPVGIVQLTHTFVQEGFLPVLRLMALLSLSLAIMNILPFPPLDGGRLFFILIEVVIGRKISSRFESLIHVLGFFAFLFIIVLVTYNDILKLF